MHEFAGVHVAPLVIRPMTRDRIVRAAAIRRAAGLHALEQRPRTKQLDGAELLAEETEYSVLSKIFRSHSGD